LRIVPGIAADKFKSPFANENAARAGNNGALPPDLSLIIKARHDGANYVNALLTGYKDAPADKKVPEGMYYNTYFAGQLIAMAPPLSDEGVDYSDKTTGDRKTAGRGRRDVPDLGGTAGARGTQADGYQGDPVPASADGSALCRQTADLGGRSLA
jgi:hypothetical protein